MVYLDNAATTQIDPEVYNAMLPWISWGNDNYGNPGSLHSLGRRSHDAIENARVQVAEFIGSEPKQIVFTSGGSEGNSLVFLGMRKYLEACEKTHIIVSAIEHDSVLKAANRLEKEAGFCLTKVKPRAGGHVCAIDVEYALCWGTGLTSVMVSNNETGVQNTELGRMARLAHRAGSFFHTDAVQAAGFDELDVKKIECDFMTLSAHKLHGPKGVGALFVKRSQLLSPIICGGNNQEFGLRGGTENVAGIVGFGKACEIAKRDFEANRLRIEKAAMAFMVELSRNLAGTEMFRNGMPDIAHNKTVNICFPGVDAETLVLLLDSKGVCASAGSACNSKEQEPSHVLKAMGITDDNARSSMRFSFSKYNAEQQVIEAARVVADCVHTLRGMK